tara:strand:- start:43 stop:369 length:327 start_codon:yes stop_codon:yes gene_type:complete
MSRYGDRSTGINNLDVYKDILDSRGVRKIKQYRTTELKQYEDSKIGYFKRIWKDGDTFWNLANRYYGDPSYWYIIARFNNAPTEAHVSIGDVIKIPADLSLALQKVVV